MTKPSRAELAPQDRARSTFRGDIQGLRAVAVVLVLLWHGGLSALPGGYVGVDVFFVISGFLMTGLLFREASTKGTISLRHFYARRARRLLPASALLIICVAVATRLFLPSVRWASIGHDLLASTLFGMNWRLSSQSTDYLVSTSGIASPLQHFWSLGVEEQFYFIWPLLMLLFTIGARRRGVSLHSAAALLLATIAIPSLVWSVLLSASNPGSAYFVTTTRLWELAAGGAVAVFAAHLRDIPKPLAVAVGWGGLAAAVAAGFIYDTNTTFPGYAALLPVLGTAAVIAVGPAAGPAGPVAVLGLAPLRKLGDWSYSLYLWHWPLIVIAGAKWGELSQLQGLAVIAFSFVPALLAFYLVEEPARTGRLMHQNAGALKSGGVILLATSTAALLFTVVSPTLPPATAVNAVSTKVVGAKVLAASPLGDPAGIALDDPGVYTPQPGQAEGGAGCMATPTEDAIRTCDVGDLSSSVHAVLVGDSHADQWVDALDEIATQRKWRLTLVTKSRCPYTSLTVTSSFAASCEAWNRNVAAYLATKRPAVIITSQAEYGVTTPNGALAHARSARVMAADMKSNYGKLIEAGTKVVVLLNTPGPRINMGDCISGNGGRLKKCAVPRSKAMQGIGVAQTAVAKALPDVSLINLNDAICPVDPCAPVIGGVLVYIDNNHITRTYGLSLAPRLLTAMNAALRPAG
jgi:peptidoglycan/LPS O-acetylase OafA/YrhL